MRNQNHWRLLLTHRIISKYGKMVEFECCFLLQSQYLDSHQSAISILICSNSIFIKCNSIRRKSAHCIDTIDWIHSYAHLTTANFNILVNLLLICKWRLWHWFIHFDFSSFFVHLNILVALFDSVRFLIES